MGNIKNNPNFGWIFKVFAYLCSIMTLKKAISKHVDWKSYLEEFSQKISELYGNLEFDDQFYQANWEELISVFKEGADIIRGVQPFCRRICFRQKPSTRAGFLLQLMDILKSIFFHSDYYFNNTLRLNMCYCY